MAKKVLLIEYEPRSVERLRGLLPAPEHAVTVAHDGEEGLNAFATSRFDLVLLAGMLPRLPSAEVIREIRKKGGATAPPILLMMSGYKGGNPKADAQRVGAFDILVKPFTDETLLAAVRAAVESTDLGARTMRIPTLNVSSLTSSDIFSDVLEDLGGESPPLVGESPAPLAPVARAPHGTESEVERRLQDTLSGLRKARAAASSTPSARETRLSTDAEIDRMISDTLSGISRPTRKTAPLAPYTAVSPREEAPAPTAPPAPQPVAPAPRLPETAPAISGSGPDRFDQYQIVEKIASGGMAELYKARRSGAEGFEKTVAIKKILPHLADDEQFIAMFADEAKLAAQLNHPNIVHIYDLGKIESGGYFIAMEYVEGRDLRAILEAGRETGSPLPVPLAVYVAAKVASALDYAHRRRDADGGELNIVHRDVSPQNILISYEGDIKLCDFGIAKAASKVSQTKSGALKGKIQYMSPEQAWGKPIDRRSDLFSLGVVLSEMLTGERLFRGDSDMTVLEKVRVAEVAAPSSINPEVPKSLDAIVLKTLAVNSDERHGNASDLLRDLESVLYSYSPAPGSADLAIYLHRLQSEEAAAAEARQREVARAPEEPERKRRSKGTPFARRATGSVPAVSIPSVPPPSPPPAAPIPAKKVSTGSGVFGTFSSKRVEAERKGRKPLFVAIGFAVVLLIGASIWLVQRGVPSLPTPASVTKLPATAIPEAVPTPLPELAGAAAPTPSPAVAMVDPKAVEAEVSRQLAARKKELEQAMQAGRSTRTAAEQVPPATEEEPAPLPSPEPAVVSVEPTLAPTEPPPAIVEVVPTRPPPAVSKEPEVSRGDLVGPGPGVIEPVLVSRPRVVYPPIARQQRVRVAGKVVLLVLVSEEGAVQETRLQQGLPSRSGINEAVISAVKSARFKPATKNGVPVKMWRTVVVDVQP